MIDEVQAKKFTAKFDELISLVKRPRKPQELLDYLHGETDFFTAPASTRFHGAYKYGLLEHSIGVYDALNRLCKTFPEIAQNYKHETKIIVALLHDVCKANFYKQSFRNVKNEQGIWEQVPCYTIDDKFPIGHGEKSVILIQKFLKLNDEEIMAIRWHMAGYDEAAKGYIGNNTLYNAVKKYPLIMLLHFADQAESNLYKHTEEN